MGNFLRIHRSHIVNLSRITKILKQDGGMVIMENGETLSISSERRAKLYQKLEDFKL